MTTEIRMPQMGLTMTEGIIGSWYKQVGDQVKIGELLYNVETDKLANDIESEAEGTLLAIYAQAGDTVPVQGLLCVVGQPNKKITIPDAAGKTSRSVRSGGAGAEEQIETTEVSRQEDLGQQGGRIRISPLAKKTALAMEVEYQSLIGTGVGGRIIRQDILQYAEQTKKVTSVLRPEVNTTVEKRIKLQGMRKVVAERMYRSYFETPVVTQNMKIDVTDLVQLRQQINGNREWKFTFNDFFLKAVAKALAANKHILVTLDGEEIIQHEYVHLGMAVAVLGGLIVPVIRDADQLTLEALSKTAKDLSVRAREGKLGVDEYKGSTFTVSNLGMFGIEAFTPIINQPEAAILGVCAIEDELVIVDEKITVRKKLRISLTYDHRLLDGATAAQFQLAVKQLLEHPWEIVI
jgi:pyruvate dehydrogenase E2 component (dihydrolipoamide acetyltransferase)